MFLQVNEARSLKAMGESLGDSYSCCIVSRYKLGNINELFVYTLAAE